MKQWDISKSILLRFVVKLVDLKIVRKVAINLKKNNQTIDKYRNMNVKLNLMLFDAK